MQQSNSLVRYAWVALPFLLVGLALGQLLTWSALRLGTLLATVTLVAAPFILWLFFSEMRQAVPGLAALKRAFQWWHGLWLLAFLSMLVFRVRGVGDIAENPLDTWAMFRVAVEAIVALLLLLRLALRRTEWLGQMFRGLVGAMAVYGLVAVASTLWSVYPAWTFYKGVEFLTDIALLASIMASVDFAAEFKSLFEWTWLLYGLLLATVWVGVILWPQQALYAKGFKIGVLGFRLEGVLPAVSSNDVGTFAAILAIIALARLLPIDGPGSNRAWYGLLFAASMVTMVFSQTRSALAGFLVAVFLLLYFSGRFAKGALMSVVVAPAIVLSTLGGLVWTFLQRGQTEAQIGTLSSRLDWWTFAWERFLERPLTGFGAYAAGRFAVLAKLGLSETSTMHSDYLEVIVGTGVWGLVPLLVAIIGAWWYLARFLRSSSARGLEGQLAYEAIAVLGLLTVRSIFMTLLTWHAPLHFLAILGLAEYFRRQEIEEVSRVRATISSAHPVANSPGIHP
ncbi:MAG: O-antigen ligase family protein [Acidobacteriia bacterium]|nr:O-antigen ligase family protein [Terriglobia bacterium]